MKIEILKAQPGSNPESLWTSLVGCILPVEKGPEMLETNCIGGTPEEYMGYSVRWEDAINSLREKSPILANSIDVGAQLLFLSEGVIPTHLCFRQEVCREIH